MKNISYYFKKSCKQSCLSKTYSYSSLKKYNGLTLVELLTTLTILAIITTIAAPSIIGQLATMEAKRIRNEITNALKMAKAESLIRRQNVFVCLTNGGGQCDKDGDQSILVFLDKNNDKQYSAANDILLSENKLNLKYGRTHLVVGAGTGGYRHYTRFSSDSGKPRGFMGHIKYCPTAAFVKNSYQISFNMPGVIRFKPNSLHPTGCSS